MTEDVSSRSGAQRVALISILAAVVLIAAKLIAGILSGSLSLLSEAAHSGLDAGATLLTYVAVRIASRPPDREHPYGHGKAENISALIETVLLLILALAIVREAFDRLTGEAHPVEATWYAFAVMGLSIVVDASRARVLKKAGRRYHSPALEADALHFTADLLTSTAVIIGLVLVRAGFPEADAYGGLFIGAYVGFSAIRLGRRSVDVLMDRAPTGGIERIEHAALDVEGVEEVRRARLRYVGGQPQADVTIAISRTVPLETAHQVTEKVEQSVQALLEGADVVVHVEPLADERQITQRVLAVAARDPRVRQVHNVVCTYQSDGVHVSLHAKFPGAMTLQEAHSIAEELESELMKDMSAVSRVDTHIEPLEATALASEVTETQADLVMWATHLAERQPEVRSCHEVVVSETEHGLSLVMHCDAAAGLSVEAVHNASTRIEDEIHRRWKQVERVTVHFEPADA